MPWEKSKKVKIYHQHAEGTHARDSCQSRLRQLKFRVLSRVEMMTCVQIDSSSNWYRSSWSADFVATLHLLRAHIFQAQASRGYPNETNEVGSSFVRRLVARRASSVQWLGYLCQCRSNNVTKSNKQTKLLLSLNKTNKILWLFVY